MAVWLLRLLVASALLSPLALATELQLYTEENPPLNVSRAGQADGLASVVVRELLRRTGDRARIEVVPWARGYKRAQSGANIGLFVAVRTPEREALFQWVGPLVSTTTSFYGKRGSGLQIASLDDAKRVAGIAVPRDWYSHQFLQKEGFGNLHLVPKPHEMLRMTLYGRVPLMVYEDQLLPSLVTELGGSLSDFERLYSFMHSSSYIVFSLGTEPQLVRRWQAALDAMKADGSLARIHEQWLPAATEQT
jgi:polar amino acid transport system substrate-binding protein